MLNRTLTAMALFALASSASAELTLFEHDNFAGRKVTAGEVIDNLADSGFNDRASSAIVRRGTWQLCDDAYFRGRCVNLQPGEYPSLGNMGLNDRISSAREIGGWGPPPAHGHGGGWGGGARAVLYAGPNFHGDRYVVEGDSIPNLADTGFNDRAQSLRVERGYWIFCSDAGFGGRCRTFGPGSYADLGPALDNRVSSGRRISNQYPYNGPPNWR